MHLDLFDICSVKMYDIIIFNMVVKLNLHSNNKEDKEIAVDKIDFMFKIS